MSLARIRYSPDGVTWTEATLSAQATGDRGILLRRVGVFCGQAGVCLPFVPITVEGHTSTAFRSTGRRGYSGTAEVNPLAVSSDTMWCRRGSQNTIEGSDVRGVR